MRATIFKQYKKPWASLPFPSGSTVKGCGCGLCSVVHVLIEDERYKNETPATVRGYMVKWAVRGQGLIHDGIPDTLRHYGMDNVKEFGRNATMKQIFEECGKGDRLGVILFYKQRNGRTIPATGPDGTTWTGGGHFIAFTDYKVKNGKHYFYMKDSGPRNHDGWFSYEKSMAGCIWKVWTCTVKDPAKETPEEKKEEKPQPKKTIKEDGVMGVTTTKASQRFFGTTDDGVISGQNAKLRRYYPNIISTETGRGGSVFVKAWQHWADATEDGTLGQGTVKAIQNKLKALGYYTGKVDGIAGSGTVKAWQAFLNDNLTGEKNSAAKTETPATPQKIPAAKTETKVIDVSYNQHSINWDKVKASGIEGAIIRAGYRGYGSGKLQKDSCFDRHITGAHRAGLRVGIYFFTEAINAKEGKEEARYAINLLHQAGIPVSFPIAVDTEAIKAKGVRANNISRAKRTEAIKAFCEEIQAQGYDVMIYASTDWLNNKLDMSKLPFKVWVAQYNDRVTFKGEYVMWQYTSTGKIGGISGVVDLNKCYI